MTKHYLLMLLLIMSWTFCSSQCDYAEGFLTINCCPWQSKWCYEEDKNVKSSKEGGAPPPLNCSRASQQDDAELFPSPYRWIKTSLVPWLWLSIYKPFTNFPIFPLSFICLEFVIHQLDSTRTHLSPGIHMLNHLFYLFHSKVEDWCKTSPSIPEEIIMKP